MRIVVFVTAKDRTEAAKIAKKLVGDRLIACATIVKDVESVFRWKEKVEKAGEVLLILKSKADCFPSIIKAVRSAHSYEVPEIIALPIFDGSKEYLEWVDQNCDG